MLLLEGTDICSNEACGRRFNAEFEGWGGACDACTALADDHFSGQHKVPNPDCHDCL